MKLKDFDTYQFAGILAPGAMFLFGLAYLYPDRIDAADLRDFNLGGLGVLVIAVFVAGHLVQSFGDILSRVNWALWGGKPTTWVIDKSERLLSAEQYTLVGKKITDKLGIKDPFPKGRSGKKVWMDVTRQIDSYVRQCDNGDRL